MTDEGAYRIIDNLIAKNRSFAIYRIPGEKVPQFVLQAVDTPLDVIYDIEDLNMQESFVISPFQASKQCPIIVIRSDITALSAIDEGMGEPKAFIDSYADNSCDEEDYKRLFGLFHQPLMQGKLEKLVLSRTYTVPRKTQFSPGKAFYMACERYIYSLVYLFHTPQSGVWVGGTPEILLSGKAPEWKTIALAGTRLSPSGDQPANWDVKNKQEQELVSSYIRSQLASAGIASSTSEPYTVRAGELIHLRTDFSFASGFKVGNLLKLLHPTPAVCGLPKEEAYHFILDNEGYDRRYYSGFLGRLNPKGQSDLYVNLRCMYIGKDSLTLYAGGGLLPSSTQEEEWEETEHKLRTMLSII